MRLKWTIEYLDVATLTPISSRNFPNDQLIVYQGFYGTPSYVIWYARPYPDKPRQFKISSLFNLTLHTIDHNAPLIQTFKVQSVVFDVSKKMWKVFAISSIWYNFSNTNSVQYFEYQEEVSGIEVIKDAISSVFNSFEVNYDIKELDKLAVIKYKYVAFDKETSIIDIISKICNENRWEWYLASDMLHVSPSLWLYPYTKDRGKLVTMVAKETEHIKDAVTWFFRTRTIDATGAEPMTIFDESRVIWVKYLLGESIGDMMTIMCQRNTGELIEDYPYPYISESTYNNTLSGIAKQLSLNRIYKSYAQMPVIAGRIFGSVSDTNSYQTPKFSGDMIKLTKNWETRKYFTENDYGGIDSPKPVLYAEKPRITTPYAGDAVGMLFPQEENQHRLLFSPNGERDMPLVGPGFFAEDETIPTRASEKDFRLQLPDGTSVYCKDGETFIISGGTKIELSAGGLFVTQTEDQNINKITIDSSGITLSGNQINGLQPTLKITKGQVEILGNLKVTGQVDMIAGKTAGLPNIDGAVLKKLPPGP